MPIGLGCFVALPPGPWLQEGLGYLPFLKTAIGCITTGQLLAGALVLVQPLLAKKSDRYSRDTAGLPGGHAAGHTLSRVF